MVVSQLTGLALDGVGDLGPAVADVDAVQAGEGVQKAVAPVVLDEHAFAVAHDPRRRTAAVGVGV